MTAPTHTHYPLTLSGHLFRRQAMKGSRTGRFSRVFARLDLAARIIAREVNRAGLAGVLGAAGAVNVQGEDVQKLDRIGNQVFLDALSDDSFDRTVPPRVPSGLKPGGNIQN